MMAATMRNRIDPENKTIFVDDNTPISHIYCKGGIEITVLIVLYSSEQGIRLNVFISRLLIGILIKLE